MKINAPLVTELREAGPMINQSIELQEQERATEKLLFSSDYSSGEVLQYANSTEGILLIIMKFFHGPWSRDT